MFYTYIHRRLSDNKPFYVGKGRKKRVSSHKSRNAYWMNVVAKHGLKVEVVAPWRTEVEAFEHEKFLIWCFRDMGFSLTNRTDGGEGVSGYSPPKDIRDKIAQTLRAQRSNNPEFSKKMSLLNQGKVRSEETRKKMADCKLGVPRSLELREHLRLLATGRKHSSETKAKISAITKGRKIVRSEQDRKRLSDARRGALNPFARAVKCVETGIIYPTCRDAANAVCPGVSLPRWAGGNVGYAAKESSRTAYDYHWVYADTIANVESTTSGT
jgi:hypothetical protein